MEAIAVPASFVVLVWFCGPAGGGAAVGGRRVRDPRLDGGDARDHVCHRSVVFALNLTLAMGLALAIDYTLLIVSRFRDELADGTGRDEALVRTMATAGRTALFSAITVALSMIAMALFPMYFLKSFPMYFLKSFACAGIAVVAFAAVAAVVVTPAAIVLLGERLDALDVRRFVRRLLGRSEPVQRPVEERSGTAGRKPRCAGDSDRVGDHRAASCPGRPFLGVNWGYPDDRVLPGSAPARQVGDELRAGLRSTL
jgi:putative drug exporter of the RND superfamily